MFASALRKAAGGKLLGASVFAGSSAYLTSYDHSSQCLFGFGGKSAEEKRLDAEATRLAKLEEDKKQLETEIAGLRARLGPLAALDLNNDGVIDQKDALLAAKIASGKAMHEAGGDAILAMIGDKASEAIATGMPAKISWGFCSGYCTGFAAKKAGKLLAVGVGGVFALLQGLAYNGYIVVDQKKIGKDFELAFDLNSDGELDNKDAQLMYDKAMEVLSFNMPSGGGFVTGIVLGLRTG